MIPTRDELIDLAKRAGWTAVQAGLAVIVAAPQVVSTDELQTLGLAALAAAGGAGLSVLKSYAAQWLDRRRATT